MPSVKRKCVFILGMHRSGTSAITGALQQLGVELGPDLMEANQFNQKGYFENNHVFKLNEEILKALDISWDTTFLLEDGWEASEVLIPFGDRIKNVILGDFHHAKLFAIKDPRLSILLPYWTLILSDFDIEIVHLIMIRHPFEVWKSLAERESFSPEKASMIWLDHNLAAEKNTRGEKRIFINYSLLMTEPLAEIKRIIDILPLEIELSSEMVTSIEEFLQPELYHHHVDAESHQLLPMVMDLYDLLQKLSKHLIFDADSAKQLSAIQAEYKMNIEFYGKTFINELSPHQDQIHRTHQELRSQTDLLQNELKSSDEIKSRLLREKVHLEEILEQERSQNKDKEDTIEKQKQEMELMQRNLLKSAQRLKEQEGTLKSVNKQISGLEAKIKFNYEALPKVHKHASGKTLTSSEKLDALKTIGFDQESQLSAEKQKTLQLEESLSKERIESVYLNQNLKKSQRLLLESQTSISYAIGRLTTGPFRWIYTKMAGDTPINRTAIGFGSKLILSILRNPITLVSAVSVKNILTLGRALQEEDYATIGTNLDKLLGLQVANTELNNQVTDTSHVTVPVSESFDPRFRILYVSPNLPDFDTSSGGKRATRMLELLAQNFEIHAFTLGARPSKYVDKLTDLGVNVIGHSDFQQLKLELPEVDVIIFAWFSSYYSNLPLCALYKGSKIIMDSVDVHWIREERSFGIGSNLTREEVIENKRREINAYRSADVVWTVTEPDRQAVLVEIPDANVRIVSNVHEPVDLLYSRSEEPNILFFGGYQHLPNISAVEILARRIFPDILMKIPSAKLLIAGSKAPNSVKELGKMAGVEFLGFIEEVDIPELYDRSMLTIAPLQSGAGIKGKICEAISYMTPVITNSIGNEGINLEDGQDAFITDDFNEMAALAVEILEGKYDLEAICKSAQEHLSKMVSSDVVQQNMIQSLVSRVSICIVTYNKKDLLADCLNSIFKNTRYPNYQIFVHSNGCNDGTKEYLQQISQQDGRIIPILSAQNDVFVIPNNRMMEMCQQDDVVLLNNDTTVTENWLMGLYRAAYSDQNIGIAGSKILYPNGTLQEFGSELYENGSGRNIGKGEDPDQIQYNQLRKVGYVSGCSMYIKRSTINQLGVFDEEFHPCYCEDSDYCYTAWEHDMETAVTPHSIVYHHEGATSGTDVGEGYKRYQSINMEKFLQKHRAQLESIQLKIDVSDKQMARTVLDNVKHAAFGGYKNGIGNVLLSGTQRKGIEVDRPEFVTVNSFDDYQTYLEDMATIYQNREELERKISFSQDRDFDIWGYNFMIKETVPYKVNVNMEGQVNDIPVLNLRESLICPKTGTNS
ncbi:MAG: glycosyltransferase, partial [Saprospiraceae bacterium]|nr:glycosyltransferase [Saprospiraceae bacterium]